jgi:hypothetical protein
MAAASSGKRQLEVAGGAALAHGGMNGKGKAGKGAAVAGRQLMLGDITWGDVSPESKKSFWTEHI